MEYPLCNAEFPFKVGDLECDVDYLTVECKYDNNDCCKSYIDGLGGYEFDSKLIGNGICEDLPGERYNTKECGYDNGDCIVPEYAECRVTDPTLIGNRICNEEYNIEACGFDGGDCCDVPNPILLGNGLCEGYESPYNTEECSWDGGDCESSLLTNGVITLDIHNRGYINSLGDYKDHYDGLAVGAMRKTDNSKFWVGTSNHAESVIDDWSVPFHIQPLIVRDDISAYSSFITGDNELEITHQFKPSEADDLYLVTVTFHNLSNGTLTHIRYRREMNWAMPSNPIEECTTVFARSAPSFLEYSTVESNKELHSMYDGEYSGDNFLFIRDSDTIPPVAKKGNGEVSIQFLLKNQDESIKELSPGEAFSFDFFYGVSSNKQDALEALASIGTELAVANYPAIDSGCDATNPGSPYIFILGFRGVGGTVSYY